MPAQFSRVKHCVIQARPLLLLQLRLSSNSFSNFFIHLEAFFVNLLEHLCLSFQRRHEDHFLDKSPLLRLFLFFKDTLDLLWRILILFRLKRPLVCEAVYRLRFHPPSKCRECVFGRKVDKVTTKYSLWRQLLIEKRLRLLVLVLFVIQKFFTLISVELLSVKFKKRTYF